MTLSREVPENLTIGLSTLVLSLCAKGEVYDFRMRVLTESGTDQYFCKAYHPCLHPCRFNDVMDSIELGKTRYYRCLKEEDPLGENNENR